MPAGDALAYIGLCCAKCGGNMPLNIPGGGIPETHEFRIKLGLEFMRMQGLRDNTSRVSEASLLGMPAAGKFMAVQESMDMIMGNLAIGYSFTEDFFAGLMYMHMDKRMDMRFNSMMQTMTGVAGYTMKSHGPGDMMLMTKYLLYANDPLIPSRQLSLLAGLSIPTGSIDERNATHPLAGRQKELLPYGMQLGSGTFRTYDNRRNYRWGHRARVDAYAMYQLRYDWVAELQLNFDWQGKIRGEADEAVSGASGRATQNDPTSPYMTPLWDPNNYGGSNLFATVGLQWQPAPLHILNLQLGLPLYRNLNGPQLERDWRVMFTWYVEIPTKASIRALTHPTIPSKLGF